MLADRQTHTQTQSSGGSRGVSRVSRHPPFCLGVLFRKEHILKTCRYGFLLNRVLREHEAGTIGTSKGFDIALCHTTAWRQLFLLRPKKLFGSGNVSQNN